MKKVFKSIVCIGDSLTEGDYGIAGKRAIKNVKEENYPYFLECISHANVKNFGRSGYTSSSFYENLCKNEDKDLKSALQEAELVLVLLGTNGGMSPTDDTVGNRDYMAIIEYCKSQNENVEIVLITPPYATQNSEYSNCGYYDRVADAAKKVRMLAKEYSFSLIDIFAYEEFCEENVCKYQSADGLHMNEAGYKLLAEYIYQQLLILYPNWNEY